MTAGLVGWYLRERTGWEVGFGAIFLTLFVTGYAPALAVTPLYGATIAVAVPLMCANVLAYAATHPLRDDVSSNARTTFKRDPGALNRYRLELSNAGRADVTNLSLVRTEGSPGLAVERARMEVYDEETGYRSGALLLRQGQTCPPGVARLDAVWVRYTVLGMRHEQRIPLVDGPSVRCR